MLKGKSCMCSVDLEKAFDRVSVIECAMQKIGIPNVLVGSKMKLYDGVMTRVRVDFVLSEEFEFKVGRQQDSVSSHFSFAIVVDVMELALEDVLSESLYADDIVLMSEMIEGLRNKFMKWMDAFVSKSLKITLGKPR